MYERCVQCMKKMYAKKVLQCMTKMDFRELCKLEEYKLANQCRYSLRGKLAIRYQISENFYKTENKRGTLKEPC